MSHTAEKPLKYQEFTQASNCEKVPICPYRRLECIKFDSILKRAVCQSKGNQYSKVIRCCWLPSWVPNGLHLAVLSGGACMSEIRGLSEREVEELYRVYAKSFGDCEAPKEVSARHGDWALVGHGKVTNGYCGRFLNFKICNRVELHCQSTLEGD